MNTDEKITLYLIDSCCSEFHNGINYTLIGERQDGQFVKYFDTDSLFNRYFGNKTTNNTMYFIDHVKSKGDIIIFPIYNYDKHKYFAGGSKVEPEQVGEFRCKWDSSAQWFSVESIVY